MMILIFIQTFKLLSPVAKNVNDYDLFGIINTKNDLLETSYVIHLGRDAYDKSNFSNYCRALGAC